MSLSDALLVEVKRIEIRGAGLNDELKVAIKHARGTEQVFDVALREMSRLWNGAGRKYLEMDAENATTMELKYSRLLKSNILARSQPIKLTMLKVFEGEHQLEPVKVKKSDHLWTCILYLGETTKASTFARRLLADAKNTLENVSINMDKLGVAKDILKGIIDLAVAVAGINPYASIAMNVLKLGFQKVEAIPDEYEKLKSVRKQCIALLANHETAMQEFDMPYVRGMLADVLSLAIECLSFVVKHYSGFNVLKDRDEIKKLSKRLAAAEGNLTRAYLTEIRHKLGLVADVVLDTEGLVQLLAPSPIEYTAKAPCLPGTRPGVLTAIKKWATNRSRDATRIFWLYGSAGRGKSAVATTLSRDLTYERLVGNFFCARNQPGRRDPGQLLRTLAYAFAKVDKGYKEKLVVSLGSEGEDKSLHGMFKYLFDTPMRDIMRIRQDTDDPQPQPALFIVDALDELEASATVARLLVKIARLAPWLKLVITSRDLPDIRVSFKPLAGDTADTVHQRNLDDDDASDDIHAYIAYHLNSPDGRLVKLKDSIHTDKRRELFEASGGLFIWVATAIRFIDDPHLNEEGRMARLNTLPNLGSSRSDETGIFAMYDTVLRNASEHASESLVRWIVGTICITAKNELFSLDTLHAFLPPNVSCSFKEMIEIMQKLQPVLRFTMESEPHNGGAEPSQGFVDQTKDEASRASSKISVHHASFLDFVADNGPCGTSVYWMDPVLLHRSMAQGCLEIMDRGTRRAGGGMVRPHLKFNICRLETSYKANSDIGGLNERIAISTSPELRYSCMHWVDHSIKSKLEGDTENRGGLQENGLNPDGLRTMFSNFVCSEKIFFWLEMMSLMGKIGVARDVLFQLAHDYDFKNDDLLGLHVSELRIFADRFFSILSLSTPHLYTSLAWIPTTSRLHQVVNNSFSGVWVVQPPIIARADKLQVIEIRQNNKNSLSPDGSRILAAEGTGDPVRVYDLATGSIVCERRFDQSPSPDKGNDEACTPTTKSSSFSIKLALKEKLMTQRRKKTPVIEEKNTCHDGYITSVCYLSPTEIVILFRDGRLLKMDADSLEDISDIVDTGVRGTCIAALADKSHVAIGCREFVTFWDTGSNTVQRTIKTDLPSVEYLAVSPDGCHFATSTYSTNLIYVHDVRTGDVVWTITSRGSYIRASSDYVALWDIDDKQIIKELVCNADFAAFTLADTRLVSGNVMGISIWDADAIIRQEPVLGHAHDGAVVSVAFARHGAAFVSGSKDGTVKLWDASTGHLEKVFPESPDPYNGRVSFVAYSPERNEILAKMLADDELRGWNAQTGNEVYRVDTSMIEGKEKRICTLRDTSTNVIKKVELDSSIQRIITDNSFVWRAVEKERLHGCLNLTRGLKRRSGWYLDSYSFRQSSLPGSAFVYTGSCKRKIHCRDSKTQDKIGIPLVGHSGCVSSVSISPKGDRLVSGSTDKTIRVWDTQSFHWKEDTSLASVPLRGPQKIPASIPDDGWLRTRDGGLLLWVPREHRNAICDMSIFCISRNENDTPRRIDWESFCHGERWTEIYTGQSK